MSDQIDTKNDFFFGVSREKGITSALNLPIRITDKQCAFRTAAWILFLGESLPDDGTKHTFTDIRQAIANT